MRLISRGIRESRGLNGNSPTRMMLWGMRRVLSLARVKPLGTVGLAVLIGLIAMAIFADLIATNDPLDQDVNFRLRGPSSEFLFGTDMLGRDVFSRVVHGARISLYVGLTSVAIATAFGVAIGLASGYLGGKLDLIVQRIIDAFLGFPVLVLALLLVVVLSTTTTSVVVAIVVALTPQMVRLARAEAIKARGEMFVKAAEAIGATRMRILARHILPNAAGSIVILATSLLEQAIVAEASLSFLGLGVPPPDPSWGRLLKEGTGGFLETAPWITIFPAAALTLAVFSFGVIGDGLRDLTDPQFLSRGRPEKSGRNAKTS